LISYTNRAKRVEEDDEQMKLGLFLVAHKAGIDETKIAIKTIQNSWV